MLLRKILICAIASITFLGTLQNITLKAERHLVTPEDLRQAIQKKSEQRENNLAAVKSFFASERVRSTLQKAPVDLQRVEAAIPTLDDAELARLAERVRTVEDDITAGALTNQEITYILIALATAVIILVIVEA